MLSILLGLYLGGFLVNIYIVYACSALKVWQSVLLAVVWPLMWPALWLYFIWEGRER